jgi:hypothetical protein
MVKTAQAWGWSPSAIIRNAADPREHHPADYALAHAVQVLTEEKCPSCGVPLWHAYSEDAAVGFTEDLHVCYSCKHADEKGQDRKPRPGERYTVRAVPAEGYEELPSRSEFYAAKLRKAALKAAREKEKQMADAA